MGLTATYCSGCGQPIQDDKMHHCKGPAEVLSRVFIPCVDCPKIKIPRAGTEDYYAKQEQFVRYVDHKVNPARKESYLEPIREYEARECYRILHQIWVNGELADDHN